MFRFAFLLLVLFAFACCQRSGEEWQQTRLYFGLRDTLGASVPVAAWEAFRDSVIVPAFPEGFTVYESGGHWREPNGKTVREPGRVLDVVYKASDNAGSKLESIRDRYKKYFHQQSVLRVDSRAEVSF